MSEELTLSRWESGVVLDCLNDFLLQFEAAKQYNYYSLPTPKAPIGYTFMEDHLYCHHIHEIRKHSKRHIRLPFWLEVNKECTFSFKKLTLTGSDFLLEEIIGLRHSEVKTLLPKRKFNTSTCFLTWISLQFWLVDYILQQYFLLISLHWEFISHSVSFQNSYHFPVFISRLRSLPILPCRTTPWTGLWNLDQILSGWKCKISWTRHFWKKLRFH